MADESRGQVESQEDFGDDAQGVFARWMAEIDNAQTVFETWHDRVDKIVKRYRSEMEIGPAERTFAFLYSNISVLQSAVYSKKPEPWAERRFGDADGVGRAAAQILERLVNVETDSAFDDRMKAVRDDYLLGGRGIAWARYEADVQDSDSGPVVVDERTAIDFIPYKDFLHSPAPRWEIVTWVARRILMTRKALKERFAETIGEEKVAAIQLTERQDGVSEEQANQFPDVFMRAEVWEIWDKEGKQVIWISKGYNEGPLEVREPPLKLANFFPCPKPLFGCLTPDSLIPIPDYVQYQGQAREIDELTTRIGLLTEALAVRGVYDASDAALAQLLDGSPENRMIAVKDWAGFAEKGGLKGKMDFMPIDTIAAVLTQVRQMREAVIQEAYQITGISDIVRGATNAAETAAAQKIKSSYAGLRLEDRKQEVARFVRDLMELVAEIAVEQFSEETIRLKCGGDLMSDAALFGQAVALLKDERLRTFRVDFETDALILVDKQAEQKAATEFLGAVTPYMQQAIAASEQNPALGPALATILMAFVRKFRAGRELEGTLEDAIKALQEAGQQDKGPSPEEIKAQADAQKVQFEAQAKKELAAMQAQADLAMMQAKGQMDLQLEQMRGEIKARSEIEKATILGRVQADAELAKETARAQAEAAREQARVEIERIKAQAAVEAQRFTQELEARKLAIAEQEAAHRAKIDCAKLVLDAAKAGIDPTNAVAPDVQAQAMQALSETLAPLASLSDLPNVLKSVAAGMAEFARSQGAEKEVIRDPSGRAVGVRTKVSGVVLQ